MSENRISRASALVLIAVSVFALAISAYGPLHGGVRLPATALSEIGGANGLAAYVRNSAVCDLYIERNPKNSNGATAAAVAVADEEALGRLTELLGQLTRTDEAESGLEMTPHGHIDFVLLGGNGKVYYLAAREGKGGAVFVLSSADTGRSAVCAADAAASREFCDFFSAYTGSGEDMLFINQVAERWR